MERNGKQLTKHDKRALKAVLPWLQSRPEPFLSWETTGAFPHPNYDKRVHAVVSALGSEFWAHYNYLDVAPELDKLRPLLIRGMDLETLCATITFFQRGERFSDGFHGRLIEDGCAAALVEMALKVCEGEQIGYRSY